MKAQYPIEGAKKERDSFEGGARANSVAVAVYAYAAGEVHGWHRQRWRPHARGLQSRWTTAEQARAAAQSMAEAARKEATRSSPARSEWGWLQPVEGRPLQRKWRVWRSSKLLQSCMQNQDKCVQQVSHVLCCRQSGGIGRKRLSGTSLVGNKKCEEDCDVLMQFIQVPTDCLW